jgi:hypothetical protein
MPLDPGRHWLEAGITGLARQREWDAVVTADGPGGAGAEVEFVALPDGRLLLESGRTSVDLERLASALAGSIDPPFRAAAVRREELWVIGARSIDVVELERDPAGDGLELVHEAEGSILHVDGLPSFTDLPELDRLGRARGASYVVRAHRLDGRLFEVEVEVL